MMRFQLREIEVRTSAGLDEFSCVVKEVQSKVEERSSNGGPVDCEVLLIEVPASSSAD